MITARDIFGEPSEYDDELRDIFVIPITSERSEYYKIYTLFIGKGKKTRRIEEPIGRLLEVQKKCLPILEQIPLHKAAYGTKGKGALENAIQHKDFKYLLRVDIKDCYKSIDWLQYINSLVHNPAVPLEQRRSNKNIRDCSIRFIENALFLDSTKSNLDGTILLGSTYLPTGAPTSPYICNLTLAPLDFEIQKIADQLGYTYTRYIDDIHLSTTKDTRDWDLLGQITILLDQMGLKVNKKKSKWYTRNENDNVIVTGVRLGTNSKAPSHYVRTLRAILNNLAMTKKPIDDEIAGKLAYVKSLDEEKYDQLIAHYNKRLSYEPTNR